MTAGMPWWSWIAIWGGLVLALAVMLGLLAWWLFRKALVLLDDVADLAGTTALLESDDPEYIRPALAVLETVRAVRDREAARRAHRAQRRRLRHETRMARARRITSVEAARGPWPSEWYGS